MNPTLPSSLSPQLPGTVEPIPESEVILPATPDSDGDYRPGALICFTLGLCLTIGAFSSGQLYLLIPAGFFILLSIYLGRSGSPSHSQVETLRAKITVLDEKLDDVRIEYGPAYNRGELSQPKLHSILCRTDEIREQRSLLNRLLQTANLEEKKRNPTVKAKPRASPAEKRHKIGIEIGDLERRIQIIDKQIRARIQYFPHSEATREYAWEKAEERHELAKQLQRAKQYI